MSAPKTGDDGHRGGSVVCLGTGICLGSHISTLASSYIREADLVFGAMPDAMADQWLESMNPNYQSLQRFYGEGKSRRQTYEEMVEAILAPARAGRKVVGAFYGHPGVFAWPSHESIRRAQAEGLEAWMEPGISAEDCLVADLGLDPGTTGCLSYEASQFLFYQHPVDPSALMILWQWGLVGEHTLRTFATTPDKVQIAVDYLRQWYPADHLVTLYEAPFLPTGTPRMESRPLSELASATLSMITTLVIPPARPLEVNGAMLEKLGLSQDDLT
ncbi:MAG: SAM-dependent methyltransferase [Myxococcota bacterium]